MRSAAKGQKSAKIKTTKAKKNFFDIPRNYEGEKK